MDQKEEDDAAAMLVTDDIMPSDKVLLTWGMERRSKGIKGETMTDL